MGWTVERYLKSTVYEWNEAVRGYWRNYERQIWQTRELIWWEVRGNPYIKNEDKPKTRAAIMKLSMDEEVKEVKKVKPPTKEELLVFQQISYNKQ